MEKLDIVLQKDNYLTGIMKKILHTNYVYIYDGVTKSSKITQTNSVLEGDCVSPLLFNVATMDMG